MSKANSMSYEEIRKRMGSEVKAHKSGAAPKGCYSVNRLDGLYNAAAKKYGQKAANELHKEFTSKRIK